MGRSRKPWIGVLVAACTMASAPGAEAATTTIGSTTGSPAANVCPGEVVCTYLPFATATTAALVVPFDGTVTSSYQPALADGATAAPAASQTGRRLLLSAVVDSAPPSGGATPTPTPTPAPTQLPPPVAGKTLNAAVRRGKVRFKLPGSRTFVALTDPQQLPIGTTFDTTAGRVTLTSATDTKGATQHAWFYEGTFKVGQTKGSRPVTTLALAGALPSCGTARAARADAKRTRKSRHLWGDGKGRFRTSGRFSSATVRGTRWVVSDRCDGTLTRVVSGSVTVRDRVRNNRVVVRAGGQYLAPAPRRATP